MTLLAAFQVLLHRHTLDNDILVGSPLAGRTRSDVEGLIGCFVNIPLFRSNVGDNPTFRQLVARLRDVAIGRAGASGDRPRSAGGRIGLASRSQVPGAVQRPVLPS